jgi:hypothetical protein
MTMQVTAVIADFEFIALWMKQQLSDVIPAMAGLQYM